MIYRLIRARFRMEILFIVLFAYVRKLRDTKLQQATVAAAARAKQILPITTNS